MTNQNQAEREFEKANTPFTDADPRISIRQIENYFTYEIDYESNTGPFTTWREAYRAAESEMWTAEMKAEIDKLKAALMKLHLIISDPNFGEEDCYWTRRDLLKLIDQTLARDVLGEKSGGRE
jgi:hypothetical protein